MPSPSELNAIWDLQRLARSMECFSLSDDLRLPRDMQGKYPDGAPEDPDRMPEWRKGLWMATYRSLIASAALAGIYQEPLRAAKESNDAELQSLIDALYFSQHQRSFIQKFAVFRTITTPEQETPIFGFLGQWLLKNILSDTEARNAMAQLFEMGHGRAMTCAGPNTGPNGCPLRLVDGGSHSDAHLVVWELIKMYWVQEQLVDSIEGQHVDLTENEVTPPNGKAPIVLSGDFAPIKVKGPSLAASPPTDNHTLDFECSSLRSLLPTIHESSGQLDRYEDGGEVAPLHAKFFEYFLRRYVGARFHIHFFNGYEDSAESTFLQTLALFSHDDVDGRYGTCYPYDMPHVDFMSGSEILESADIPAECYSSSS